MKVIRALLEVGEEAGLADLQVRRKIKPIECNAKCVKGLYGRCFICLSPPSPPMTPYSPPYTLYTCIQ